jgi:hypothetical protein
MARRLTWKPLDPLSFSFVVALSFILIMFFLSLKRNLISVQLLDIDGFGCNFGDMKY